MWKRLLVVVVALGCSTDDGVIPPDEDGYRILGTVTDPGGLPLGRAFVNVDYELLVDGGVGPVLSEVPGEDVVVSVHGVIAVYAFRGGTTARDVVTLDLREIEADVEVELLIPYDRTTKRRES